MIQSSCMSSFLITSEKHHQLITTAAAKCGVLTAQVFLRQISTVLAQLSIKMAYPSPQHQRTQAQART